MQDEAGKDNTVLFGELAKSHKLIQDVASTHFDVYL